MNPRYMLFPITLLASYISYSAENTSITSNMVSDFISTWVFASNYRSIAAMRTHIDPNATIKVTDPVTRSVITLNRDEYLNGFPGFWSQCNEYWFSVIDQAVQGNTLTLRVNEYIRINDGSASSDATETFILSNNNDRLVISFLEIIPDIIVPNNRVQAIGDKSPQPDP